MNPSSRIKRNNERFMFECGMDTDSWWDITALRIRVSMSDMGSVTGISVSYDMWASIVWLLKAGFSNPWQVTEQRLLSENHSAHSEESNVAAWTSGCETSIPFAHVARVLRQ